MINRFIPHISINVIAFLLPDDRTILSHIVIIQPRLGIEILSREAEVVQLSKDIIST